MKRRTTILLIAMGALLVLTAAMSYEYMLGQQSAAIAAQSDLTEGLRIMEQIKVISQRPTLAGERARLEGETYGMIESAAKTAGIEATVRLMTSEKPRQVGDTVYKVQPTQVILPPVTLKQLVTMATELSKPDIGLNVESIRLSVPREAESGDLWTAEMVLTYLIYEPPNTGKQESPK